MNVPEVLWFFAGALATLAAMFVIFPWLRKRARAPWFAAVAKWALGCAVLILAFVFGLYSWLGRAPRATRPRIASTSAVGAITAHINSSAQSAGSMDEAVTGLERRLAQSGGSDADWELLAKSYEFMGRSADAAAAHEKHLAQGAGAASTVTSSEVIALLGREPLTAAARKLILSADDARRRNDYAAASAVYQQLVQIQQMTADTWADYADVTASLNGNSLVGAPEKYLQAALSLDPQHAKALWLLASLQHATGQHAQAVSTWKKLTLVLGPDSRNAKLVAANLAEDQQLVDPEAAAASMALVNDVVVRGEVVLSDKLRASVPAGLTLFIVAKAVDSPGAPVAVLRTTTSSWPVRFKLDDTLSMLPQRKLSTAGKVTVEARVSKSGQAAPQRGDLLGVTEPLDPAAGKAVRIIIERVIGS